MNGRTKDPQGQGKEDFKNKYQNLDIILTKSLLHRRSGGTFTYEKTNLCIILPKTQFKY